MSESTNVKDGSIDVKDTIKVSQTKEQPSKVDIIKSQIANGSYKILDSKTLASSFVKAEF
jgi:anti-sigma28 factor (negative regulator of flagellin synthesis)